MIKRGIEEAVLKRIHLQKVSLLVGARRVGKTALLDMLTEKLNKKVLRLNGEDAEVEKLLENRSIANYKRLLEGYEVLLIDEAQYIPDIGRKLKLMIDEIKPLHIIITGSSALDISKSGEPLVGRTFTYFIYPIAQIELSQYENRLETAQRLEERLIYGSYPELVFLTSVEEKKRYLQELVNTYLLKDILAFENVRNPQKLRDLLKLIAMQIGSEVSLDELGKNLHLSKNTVERYLDLLSKVFVIYSRKGFSKNLRKEIAKSNRWYFYDNGIRNMLIGNMQSLSLRQDIGMLWENYVLSERIKRNSMQERLVEAYFWRTYDQQEIDLIEVENNQLAAYECKWKIHKHKIPAAFAGAYPEASHQIISQDNYLGFIE
jgi:predicted AAA+ superfamily ATPase